MSKAGRFVWYELLTGDAEGAKAFYGAVMGWTSEPFRGGHEPYEIWSAHGTPLGGVMQILPEWEQGGMKPHWWAHVAVDDVDASARRAEQLGGTIQAPPADIPEVGRFAIIADPQGAPISLFRSGRGPMPEPDCRKPGFVIWHELGTTDYEAAWRFYTEMFGWQATETLDIGEWGSYLMFRHPDDAESIPTGGMFNAAKAMNVPPHWLYYVNVDSMDGALARVREHGGTVLNGPMEVPGGGRAAQCRDPQGAVFALFSMD